MDFEKYRGAGGKLAEGEVLIPESAAD